METGYELRLHRFLIGYRFAAFWLAVILIQVVPGPEILGLQEYIILTLVGVYTLLKVLSPMRWRETGSETYILLAGDMALAILLVLFTNGVDSGYLLYSLTPVITAAVLMGFRVSLGFAIVTAVVPLIAHLVVSPFTDQYAWIMDGNRLPILILYSALAFLMPVLASRTNLNIRRVIEMDAVLEERQRIRREVHDGVAQALNYLNMQAGSVTKALSNKDVDKAQAGVDDMREVVRSTYEDIREFLDQLADEAVPKPLVPALTEYTEGFSRRYGIALELEAPESLKNLSPQGELQLLRITQEALTNIRKHAQATKVVVKVADTENGVELWIRDDGVGFSEAETDENGDFQHHGLNIMRERAEILGGVLEFKSEPKKSTEVHVTIPRQKVRL